MYVETRQTAAADYEDWSHIAACGDFLGPGGLNLECDNSYNYQPTSASGSATAIQGGTFSYGYGLYCVYGYHFKEDWSFPSVRTYSETDWKSTYTSI
jgi:hypothetical protein